MQKVATKIFIYSSIAFGIIGILIVTVGGFGPNKPDTETGEILIRFLFGAVFIILPSFALSVAGKYLSDES